MVVSFTGDSPDAPILKLSTASRYLHIDWTDKGGTIYPFTFRNNNTAGPMFILGRNANSALSIAAASVTYSITGISIGAGITSYDIAAPTASIKITTMSSLSIIAAKGITIGAEISNLSLMAKEMSFNGHIVKPVEHKLQVSARGTTYSLGAYFPYVQFVFQYFDDGTEEIPNTWSKVVDKILNTYGKNMHLYPICGNYQVNMTSPTLPMMVSDLQSDKLGVYYLVSTTTLGGSTISTAAFSIRTASTSITEII